MERFFVTTVIILFVVIIIDNPTINDIGVLQISIFCSLILFNIDPPRIEIKNFKKYTQNEIESRCRLNYFGNRIPHPKDFQIETNRLPIIENTYKILGNDVIIENPNILQLLFLSLFFLSMMHQLNTFFFKIPDNDFLFIIELGVPALLLYNPVKYFYNYVIIKYFYKIQELQTAEYNNYLLYKGCLDLYNQKIEEERKLKEEQERLKREAEEKALRQKKSYWQKFWADVQKDGFAFEREIANLYRKLGFHVELTKGTGDGGVDLILLKDGVKSIVQCKAHLQSVGPEPVRALWGVKDDFKADEVILIAYSGVTSSARDFARKKNYKILDINDIINLCLKVNKD